MADPVHSGIDTRIALVANPQRHERVTIDTAQPAAATPMNEKTETIMWRTMYAASVYSMVPQVSTPTKTVTRWAVSVKMGPYA